MRVHHLYGAQRSALSAECDVMHNICEHCIILQSRIRPAKADGYEEVAIVHRFVECALQCVSQRANGRGG